MPDFVFVGASPGMYPMLRDLYGAPVGTVEPGDVAAFEEAPDADWTPCEPATAVEAAIERMGEDSRTKSKPARTDTGSEQGNDDTAATTASEEQ